MRNNLNGGIAAGNIKAQRGIASGNLLVLIFALVLILNIPILLGLQMLIFQGEDPAQSFDTEPMAYQQVEFTKTHSNQQPSEVYAYLFPADDGGSELIIVEKHPWLDWWRTVKNIHISPDADSFRTQVMCDVGFVNITVTDHNDISSFTITQTVQRFLGFQIPISYILSLIGMIILEILGFVLLRKLQS